MQQGTRLAAVTTTLRRAWAVALAACLCACGNAGPDPNDGSRELRRSLGGEPASLDPQLAGDTYAYEVLRDWREGLVTEGPRGELLPGQADGWSVSTDGLEIGRAHV